MNKLKRVCQNEIKKTEAQRYRDFILLIYTIFPLCLRDSVFDIFRFDTFTL